MRKEGIVECDKGSEEPLFTRRAKPGNSALDENVPYWKLASKGKRHPGDFSISENGGLQEDSNATVFGRTLEHENIETRILERNINVPMVAASDDA